MSTEVGTRRRIYELIRDAPGIHMRELERRMGLMIGNLQYHLHYLEKTQFGISVKRWRICTLLFKGKKNR